MLSRLGADITIVPLNQKSSREGAENQRLNSMTKMTITSIRLRPPP
jgi:hypothetical protein